MSKKAPTHTDDKTYFLHDLKKSGIIIISILLIEILLFIAQISGALDRYLPY